MCIGNGFYFINFSWSSIQMRDNDYFDIRIDFKSFFQGHRIHIPSVSFGINKYRDTAFVDYRIDCGVKSYIRAKYFFIKQCAFADFRLPIHGLSGKFHGEVKRRSSRCQCDRMLNTDFICDQTFRLINILANCRHPVGFICFRNVF